MSLLSLTALLEFSKGQTSPWLSIQNAEVIAPEFQLVKESINHLNEPFFFFFTLPLQLCLINRQHHSARRAYGTAGRNQCHAKYCWGTICPVIPHPALSWLRYRHGWQAALMVWFTGSDWWHALTGSHFSCISLVVASVAVNCLWRGPNDRSLLFVHMQMKVQSWVCVHAYKTRSLSVTLQSAGSLTLVTLRWKAFTVGLKIIIGFHNQSVSC